MGSLFKPPKYTPPPAMERSNKLLDEREARADAAEKSEKRKIAAKARARRGGGRLLYSQDRALPALGVGTTLVADESIRNPMDDERMMT